MMRDANYGSDFNDNPTLSDRADPDPEILKEIEKDIIETRTPYVEKPEVHSTSQKHQESHSYNHSDPVMPFGRCKLNVMTNRFTLK